MSSLLLRENKTRKLKKNSGNWNSLIFDQPCQIWDRPAHIEKRETMTDLIGSGFNLGGNQLGHITVNCVIYP